MLENQNRILMMLLLTLRFEVQHADGNQSLFVWILGALQEHPAGNQWRYSFGHRLFPEQVPSEPNVVLPRNFILTLVGVSP